AAHAWAEAWIEGLGWVGFDAANGICPTDNYVRIAVAGAPDRDADGRPACAACATESAATSIQGMVLIAMAGESASVERFAEPGADRAK
ncbi:MAG: transglutaminase family protein, partial [Phenylobacterium sp.]|nr:transglutaminase family protein [Phenylobacterium sp.]